MAAGINATLVADSNTTVYTSSGTTKITRASICEYGATGTTVTVYLVPNAGSASNTTTVLKDQAITSKETIILNELIGAVLVDGETVVMVAAAASLVTANISAMAF